MTSRHVVDVNRCYRPRVDGTVCMRRTGGGPCAGHRVDAPQLVGPPPITGCAVAACPLPAVEGSRYCRGHARVMGG